MAHRLALLTILATVGTAEARIHRAWTYTDLMKTADLVVIATPGATTATGKTEALPDIVGVSAERIETELDVLVVMKGKAGAKVVLHHDRLSSANAMVNGPGLVSFDPKDKRSYLMFLVREADGRYAAVSGQTDPDMAIEALQHRP